MKETTRKTITWMVLLLVMVVMVTAFNIQTVYNPYTQKLDFIRDANFSGENGTFDNLVVKYQVNASQFNGTNASFTTITQNGNIVFDRSGGINAANVSSGTFGSGEYVFPNGVSISGGLNITKDLNMTGDNITRVDCIFFISGGQICDSP